MTWQFFALMRKQQCYFLLGKNPRKPRTCVMRCPDSIFFIHKIKTKNGVFGKNKQLNILSSSLFSPSQTLRVSHFFFLSDG